MKHVHLGVQEELFAELEAAAREDKRTKSDLIRAAVEEFLARRRRRLKQESMRRYAEEMAAESAEITELTGDAVDEQLLSETEW